MDSGTLWVSAAIILACLSPFIIGAVNRKKRDDKMKRLLTKLAAENNGNFKLKEIWTNGGVALDEKGQRIYFIRLVNDSEVRQVAKLDHLKKCSLHTSRSASASGLPSLSRVQLVLEYGGSTTENAILEFFHNETDGLTIGNQLRVAENWHKIICDFAKIKM